MSERKTLRTRFSSRPSCPKRANQLRYPVLFPSPTFSGEELHSFLIDLLPSLTSELHSLERSLRFSTISIPTSHPSWPSPPLYLLLDSPRAAFTLVWRIALSLFDPQKFTSAPPSRRHGGRDDGLKGKKVELVQGELSSVEVEEHNDNSADRLPRCLTQTFKVSSLCPPFRSPGVAHAHLVDPLVSPLLFSFFQSIGRSGKKPTTDSFGPGSPLDLVCSPLPPLFPRSLPVFAAVGASFSGDFF